MKLITISVPLGVWILIIVLIMTFSMLVGYTLTRRAYAWRDQTHAELRRQMFGTTRNKQDVAYFANRDETWNSYESLTQRR